MIRRPPRSTLDRSSAASDVYKRQAERNAGDMPDVEPAGKFFDRSPWEDYDYAMDRQNWNEPRHPEDHIKYDKTRVGYGPCLLYTSPTPRDRTRSRMPSSA